MGNAGEARLDVVQIGRDELSASVNTVNASLDAMKAKLAQYEAAQRSSTKAGGDATASVKSFGERLQGIKDGIAPINATRETFERLRSNLLGFPTAIAGVVTGFVALVGELFDVNSATAQMKANAEDYAKSLAFLRDETDRFKVATGQETDAQQKLRLEHERVGEAQQKLQVQLSALQDRIAELNSNSHILGFTLGEVTGKYTEIVGLNTEIATIQKALETSAKETADAKERQLQAERDIAQAEANALAKKVIDKGTGDAFSGDPFKWDPTWTYKPPEKPKPGGGGGGPDPLIEWQDKMRKLGEDKPSGGMSDRDFRMLMRTLNPGQQGSTKDDALFAANDKLRDQIELLGARNEADQKDIELRQALAAIDRKEDSGAIDQSTADLERKLLTMQREKDIVDELAKSYREFADVITNVVAPAAPQLSATLKAIGDLYVAIQVGGEGAAKGIVASIDGILQANAVWFKSQQEKDAYLGAEQILLGIATQFVPGLQAEAEGHFIAGAGLLLLAAAGGGGGKGGGRGTGGGGGARGGAAASADKSNPALGGSSSGGPSTVIYNVEVGPTNDAQGVARAIRTNDYATRNTGYDTRRPGV